MTRRGALALIVASVAVSAMIYIGMMITHPPTSYGQSGPTVPAPTEWQAVNMVSERMEHACMRVQFTVKVGGFPIGDNGYCADWSYVDEVVCHLQRGWSKHNASQNDRWKCIGDVQWQTTPWSQRGPCLKRAKKALGGWTSETAPRIHAFRVHFIYTGTDNAPAVRVLPWSHCDWGQYG